MASTEEILLRHGVDPALAAAAESDAGVPPAPTSPEVLSERGAAVLRAYDVPDELIDACVQDSLDGSISGYAAEDAERAREEAQKREDRAEHRRGYMREYMRERRANGKDSQ